MQKTVHLYVPVEYSFKHYFLPKINPSAFESFEVDRHRHGIQRKGNNHLVVFLDFRLQKEPSQFTSSGDGATGEFFLQKPDEADLFHRTLGRQKQVAVYSLAYQARMTVIAWKLLVDITDDEKVLVRDDHGHLKAGPQCAGEHRKLLGQA